MYLLFDIGGTKTRVARSEDLDSYHDTKKFDTDPTYETGIDAVREVMKEVAAGETVHGLAGGLRGVLTHDQTLMVSDPGCVLNNWAGRPLSRDLSDAFGAPVYLENDTAIVGLGEAHYGAGRGYTIVAYHTISTGVGGARIEEGHVSLVSAGFEPGQQLIDVDRSILGAATPHTLENLISGTAVAKRRGVKAYEVPQEDPMWDELAGYLARGIKNTIVYWSPEIVVLGGSMIVGDPRIRNEDIVRHTKALLGDVIPCPPIVDAELEDEGGLYGAMALLKQKR